jgi:hypothetical protein
MHGASWHVAVKLRAGASSYLCVLGRSASVQKHT